MLVSVQDKHGSLLFEADTTGRQLQEIGVLDDIRAGLRGSLDDLSTLVRRVVEGLASSFESVSGAAVQGLTTAEVELGLRVDGEGRAFVARGTAGANVTVKLTWDLSSAPVGRSDIQS